MEMIFLVKGTKMVCVMRRRHQSGRKKERKEYRTRTNGTHQLVAPHTPQTRHRANRLKERVIFDGRFRLLRYGKSF